jgi:methylphosphotriester-DNA--protein-cysteine methyltransferase
MLLHTDITSAVFKGLVRKRNIVFGGNRTLKIYGNLHCASGKRMKKENRVFFASQQEATALGYRPCGQCMKVAYLLWKAANKLP